MDQPDATRAPSVGGNLVTGDHLSLIERLRDLLRAERQLREDLEVTRQAVADLLDTLATNRMPRIAVARRVAHDLGYGTNVPDDLRRQITALGKRPKPDRT